MIICYSLLLNNLMFFYSAAVLKGLFRENA